MTGATDPNGARVLIEFLTTWVLFAVFVFSAIAIVLTVIGLLKPDRGSRRYFFVLLAASGVCISVGLAADLLGFDIGYSPRVNLSSTIDAIRHDAERQEPTCASESNSSAKPKQASYAPGTGPD